MPLEVRQNTSPHHTIHFWGSSSGFGEDEDRSHLLLLRVTAHFARIPRFPADPEGVRHTQLSCCSERRQAGDFPLPLMSLVPLF